VTHYCQISLHVLDVLFLLLFTNIQLRKVILMGLFAVTKVLVLSGYIFDRGYQVIK